jgi:hypothetical protein
MLYQGKIESKDVISLNSKANDCDNIAVIISAQNQSNTKASSAAAKLTSECHI